MPRSRLLALFLTLSACTAEPPPPRPQVQTAPLPSMPQPSAAFDVEIAALPVRPAGAALATAGQEHALVRQRPALRPAAAMPAGRPETAPTVALGDPLAARVLAVQAAYRRWCAGELLPGDGPLLAEAGGVRLPGAIACAPPPLGQPRPLILESGRFHTGGNQPP